ncbi:MAG: porin [Akkermansiaceae bacterium]|nr:porin [Akkermansiaceae bacterium]
MKPLFCCCAAVFLLVGSPAWAEQEASELREEYDKIYQYEPETEIPVESDVFEPPLTFSSPFGTITLYGQFNLAYQSFDDGETTTDGIVDNGNWNSRLGFLVYKPIGDITLRARFESGLTQRNSALVTQNDTPDWSDWRRTLLRWFEVAADTPYGTLSAGQGSSASDGTAGLDDSFTFHAGATDSSDGFGSLLFRDAAGNLTNVSVGGVNNSFDGARRFRLRYDTPAYHGFTLASSYGVNVLTSGDDNDYYDVAIRWLDEIGDVSVRSALGYQWIDNPNGANAERVAGSVTAVHTPTGLNFSFSGGQQIDGASYYWLRAGWRFDVIEAGTTSVSADYYDGSDFLTDGAKSENYGLYLVQTIDAASLDLYAGWRRFAYSDRSATSYQDADGFLVGCRFAF